MQATIFNPNLRSYKESKRKKDLTRTLTIAYYKVLIIVVSKTLTANPQGFKELVNFKACSHDHIKGDY